MAGETRKERLRTILRQTLAKQLQSESEPRHPDSRAWCFPGPWGAFFDERSAWNSATRLNPDLYKELIGTFDENQIREILLAAADIKISRTTLTDGKIEILQAIAEKHRFQIVASADRWILRADRGKGGWANRKERLAEPGEPGGVRNVYIASATTLAETGRLLDQAGEDDLFGALLGIPLCCREAFDRSKAHAAREQFDFVPYVLDNTPGDMPYDWRLNYTAQYFGSSLLSFFPCSFRCPTAAAIVDSTAAMLSHCDYTWASRSVELHKTNILYTETRGLHLFRAPLRNGQISYSPRDLQSSEPTELAHLLQQGDRLKVGGKHSAQIYRGPTKIGDVTGAGTCMCVFY